MTLSRMKRLGLIMTIFLLAPAACSDTNWDWFGMKKKPEEKTSNKARPPANDSAVAAADRPKPAAAKPNDQTDPKSKEVDDKVDRYVKSMNSRNTYDPNYEGNDFQSKMRRQSDPARSDRIKKTAAMSREQGDGPAEQTGDDPSAKPQKPTLDVAREEKSNSAKLSPAGNEELPIGEEKSDTHAARTSDAESTRTDDPLPLDSKPSAAPVLSSVKVSAGPPPEPPAPKVEETPTKSAVNTPPAEAPVVDSFKKRLSDQEALAAKDPNNVEEQFKLRLIYLASGMDDKALAPATGMNSDIQEIMQAQIKSLIASRSSAQRDPSLWANKQLDAVEDLRNLVRARADLKVTRVALCKEITAFGQYVPFEPPEFKAGQPNKVALYVEVDNFSAEKTSSGKYRVLLNMRQSLLTKDGKELWNTKEENIEDLSRQRRRDFFLTAMHIIPKTLDPGEYVYKVEIEDVLAGKINSNSVTFKLTS